MRPDTACATATHWASQATAKMKNNATRARIRLETAIELLCRSAYCAKEGPINLPKSNRIHGFEAHQRDRQGRQSPQVAGHLLSACDGDGLTLNSVCSISSSSGEPRCCQPQRGPFCKQCSCMRAAFGPPRRLFNADECLWLRHLFRTQPSAYRQSPGCGLYLVFVGGNRSAVRDCAAK